MSNGLFNFKKALSVFATTPEELLARGITDGDLPEFARATKSAASKTGNVPTAAAIAGGLGRTLKSWSLQEMPCLGQQIGFMRKPGHSLAISIFVTKGGVLKSSLTLNLARMAALHGMRVCVVGLDMQCDISTALSQEDSEHEWVETTESDVDSHPSLERAIQKMDATQGLADLFAGTTALEDLILPTDIPTLFYIPETPELVALDQSLVNRNRREYWLKEKVISPLKRDFDLILMDCSPNWNRLITNSLVACDVLISPLECKINNFRNFRAFCALMGEFKEDLQADFTHLFVPTRLASGRKLSQEIYQWYRTHLSNCMRGAIRESIQGEEAMALKISIPEHAPTSVAGGEMHGVLKEIWTAVLASLHARANDGTNRSYRQGVDACL